MPSPKIHNNSSTDNNVYAAAGGSSASSCCSRNCGSSLSHSGGGGGGGAAVVGWDEEWESQQYSARIAATRSPFDSFDNTRYFLCHHAFFYDPRA